MMDQVRWRSLFVLMFCVGAGIAAGCSDDGCPVCQQCPACTLVTSFDLEPVVDGHAVDGYRYQQIYHLKDGVPDYVYPSSKLIVKNNASSRDEYNTEYRSFMEFDVTAVTGSVVAASLELVMDAFTGNPFPVPLFCYAYRADGACTLGDFGKGGTFAVDSVSYNREWVVTFDVSNALRMHVTAGDTCVGFNIRIDPPTMIETEGPGIVFRSIEAGPPARLTITQSTVVEPSSASTLQ
jgi:hypothetical protein